LSACTGLASGVVVVKVDDGAVGQSRSVESSPLSGVDERLGERHSVRDVVRAARPLEAVRGRGAAGSSALLRAGGGRRAGGTDGAVAAAAVQLAGAASPRHGEDDARRRDGVHERSLTRACTHRQIIAFTMHAAKSIQLRK